MSLLLRSVQQFQYASALFVGVGVLSTSAVNQRSISFTDIGVGTFSLTAVRQVLPSPAFIGVGQFTLSPTLIPAGSSGALYFRYFP